MITSSLVGLAHVSLVKNSCEGSQAKTNYIMFLSTLLISAMVIVNVPASETVIAIESPATEMSSASQNVVFRSTQKLSSSDGRELYFYSNGRCEGYDGDRLMFSTRYKIMGNEVRLLDERGNTVYKGTISWKVKGKTINSVSIAGTRYFAR